MIFRNLINKKYTQYLGGINIENSFGPTVPDVEI